MLMKTQIPETLNNLIHLRDVTWPELERRDKLGLVCLDELVSDCGTYRCVLGEYAYMRGLRMNAINIWFWDSDTNKEFGITEPEWRLLFGSNSYGTLKQRYTYLCNLIKEREAVLFVEVAA